MLNIVTISRHQETERFHLFTYMYLPILTVLNKLQCWNLYSGHWLTRHQKYIFKKCCQNKWHAYFWISKNVFTFIKYFFRSIYSLFYKQYVIKTKVSLVYFEKVWPLILNFKNIIIVHIFSIFRVAPPDICNLFKTNRLLFIILFIRFWETQIKWKEKNTKRRVHSRIK